MKNTRVSPFAGAASALGFTAAQGPVAGRLGPQKDAGPDSPPNDSYRVGRLAVGIPGASAFIAIARQARSQRT
mgnify:CR=1 FL=1